MLFTPPSSPVSGRIASLVPDWEQSLKVCPLRQDCVPFGWRDSYSVRLRCAAYPLYPKCLLSVRGL